MWFLCWNIALADGYLLGEAGTGITTHYNPENTSEFFSGINLNAGLGAGVIFPKRDISAMFLHARTDIDIGTIHSPTSFRKDFAVEMRHDSHSGIQYKRFIPVNLAIKDAVFRIDQEGFYSRGLYGLGIMLPKEYLFSGNGNVVNISLSLGGRAHSDLSATPLAIQPEFYVMHSRYSIRLNVLQTFAVSDSQEFSATGMLLYRFIPRMQLGVRWCYTELVDIPSSVDSQQQKFIFFVTM